MTLGEGFWHPVSVSELDDLTDVDTSTSAPTDGQALVYDSDSGLWVPGTVSGGSGSGLESFYIAALAEHYSHVNFDSLAVVTNRFLNHNRDATVQNAEVVWNVSELRAGTWKVGLIHSTGSNRPIYTLSVSSDASSWTDIGTIDGYAAAGSGGLRSTLTGITIASGSKFVRIKAATKNASSSGYMSFISSLSGLRTGS